MFPDVSEFNGVVDWGALQAAYQAGQIEAVVMRSSFGTVRADHQFGNNQAQCRARGIPAIYYHFCYPAVNSPQTEASFFNNVVGPLQPNEAMVGDFEDDGQFLFPRGQAGADWAKAFLTDLQAPQNATWFYTYTSLYPLCDFGQLAWTWPFWWADYSTRTDNPFSAIARQFTDCGSTPGVGGCCDQSNVLRQPLSQWLTLPPPPQSPPPKEEEMILLRKPTTGDVFFVDGRLVVHVGDPTDYAALQAAGVKSVDVTDAFADAVVAAAAPAQGSVSGSLGVTGTLAIK